MDASAHTISGGVKNDIYGNRLFCNRNSSVILGVFIMKIGDRCFVHGYVDEIRKDVVIIKNKGGYFGTDPGEVITVTDTAHPNWIPCSERLPDAKCGEGDIVLATCGHMNFEDRSVRWIKTMYFNGGNWCYPTGETYEQKVYAWMPLPEPYREDDHE